MRTAVAPLLSIVAISACSSNRAPQPATVLPAPRPAAESALPARVAPVVTPAPQEIRPVSPGPPQGEASPVVPTAPAPGADYRDVIKLYRANLSREFIIRQIRESEAVFYLGADQIIELKQAGVPEEIINPMIETMGRARRRELSLTAPAPGARPATSAAQPAAAPQPQAVTPLSQRWDSLVRHNPGVVIFKPRWDVGTLSYEDGTFQWVDSDEPKKNLLVHDTGIAEQFLTCLKRAGGNECFEWGFRTTDGNQYRFRDLMWVQGENARPQEIWRTLRERFPKLISSERPVDHK